MAALTSYPGITPSTGKRKRTLESKPSSSFEKDQTAILRIPESRPRSRNTHHSSYGQARPQRRKRLSPIEALPTEIISCIFLKACNPHLLDASEILAYKLKDGYTMKRFGKLLFCKTRTDYNTIQRVPADDSRTDVTAPDTDLQRKLNVTLAWEWMTLEVFQNIRSEVCAKEIASYPNLSEHGYLYKAVATRLDLDLTGSCIPRRLLRTPATEKQTEFLVLLLRLGATVVAGTYDAELLHTAWFSILESGNIWDALYMAKDMRIHLKALAIGPEKEYLLVQCCPLTEDGWKAFKAMFIGSSNTTFNLQVRNSWQTEVCTYRVSYKPKTMAAAYKYLDAMLAAMPNLKPEIWDLRDMLHDYR